MKKIHTFGILLLMMMLVGCVTAGVGFTNEQLAGIHRGMTLEQVKEVLGAPAYRSFDDKGEEWEFRVMDIKVTEMKSYLERDKDCHTRTENNKIEKI